MVACVLAQVSVCASECFRECVCVYLCVCLCVCVGGSGGGGGVHASECVKCVLGGGGSM